MSDEAIAILAKATKWHVDCTFKVEAQKFKQLIIIHAHYECEIIACAYALAVSKCGNTYKEILTKIKEIILIKHGCINLKVNFNIN